MALGLSATTGRIAWLCPMTKGKPNANANTQGRPEKVRNRGPEGPEEVRKSPGKARKGRKRPEKSGKSPEESGKVRKSPEDSRLPRGADLERMAAGACPRRADRGDCRDRRTGGGVGDAVRRRVQKHITVVLSQAPLPRARSLCRGGAGGGAGPPTAPEHEQGDGGSAKGPGPGARPSSVRAPPPNAGRCAVGGPKHGAGQERRRSAAERGGGCAAENPRLGTPAETGDANRVPFSGLRPMSVVCAGT
eukprot:gene4583-biopygen7017